MTAVGRLKLVRDSPRTWRLHDTATGHGVGGVRYEHTGDGNHYRAWLIVDGVAHEVGDALPQLAMAARAVEDAWKMRAAAAPDHG